MGTVWSAYDPQLDRKIALKVLHPAPGVGREDERVLREARMMASVNHPNVAHVYEVGSHAERIFIAMEFVAGSTLRKWRDGTEDWREIVAKYVQAARGLAAAHRAGIVHRDFKPDNALVGTDGRVRVVDFGLAHEGPPQPFTDPDTDATTESDAVATSTRHRGGTPAYMAPEQMRGEEMASLAQGALMALEQGPPAARKNASELRSWMREERLLSSEEATPRADPHGTERIASTPRSQ